MKFCFESSAFTTCGTTVSSYPTMPGNSGSRHFSFRNRFVRISSFTERDTYPARFNSPSVVGRIVLLLLIDNDFQTSDRAHESRHHSGYFLFAQLRERIAHRSVHPKPLECLDGW